MTTSHYQDELNYLRELGREFAERYPDTAGFLGAGARDPDVERLLQGFAFLTARIHERLNDQYSQVAEGFLQVLWPRILKPVPSATMVQFSPDRKAVRADQTLEAGLRLQSKRRSWGYHQFRTSRPVTLYPFQLTEAPVIATRGDSFCLVFTFELNPGADLAGSKFGALPIYISGDDPRFTYGWYLWLTQHWRQAHLAVPNTGRSAPVTLSPVGLDDDYPLFMRHEDEIPGHRILHDYFTMPRHFLFVQVDDLSPLHELGVEKTFELVVDFGTRSPSGPIRDIKPDSFRLYCSSAVNLFEATARLTLDHTRTEYVVRADEIDVEHHEVYAVNRVIGTERGLGGQQVVYRPFFATYGTEESPEDASYVYRTRFATIEVSRDRRPLIGRDCFISFSFHREAARSTPIHTISMDLLCCHRGGTADLGPGDLCERTEQVPALVSFINIDEPTPYHLAPLSPDHLWFLVSSLTVSRQSMATLADLQTALRFHIKTLPSSQRSLERLVERLSGYDMIPSIITEDGTPLRVLRTVLEFDCPQADGPQFYLFGLILLEFLRELATINTRLRGSIRFRFDPETEYVWPQRVGTCPIL